MTHILILLFQLKQTIMNDVKVTHRRGSLFTAPSHCSLAHCISRDARMNRGIASEFRKRFGRDRILQLNASVGEVAALRCGNRFVYNLVTKNHAVGKPTYNTVRRSIIAMKNHAIQHGVRCIAMPRIASGLDGLDWPRVYQMLITIFKGTQIELVIYHL